MLATELDQVRNASHGAIIVDDFADHAGGFEAGENGQINRSFSLAATFQYTAGSSAQREHMSWSREVFRLTVWVDRGPNRLRAVGSGNSRGDVIALHIDGDRERRTTERTVCRGH